MSLLIVHMEEQRAIVATDGLGYLPSGGADIPSAGHLMTKIYAVPHLPAVIAGRGLTGIIVGVWFRLSMIAQTFDEAARLMPDALKRSFDETARLTPAGHPILNGQEIALAGWSHAEGRAAGGVWVQRDPRVGFALHRFSAGDTWVGPLAPPAGGLLPRGAPFDPVNIARAANDRMSVRYPGAGMTGPIFGATVDRDGIAMRRMGDF